MGITKPKGKFDIKRPRGRPAKYQPIVYIERNMDYLTKPRALNLDGNVAENWRVFKQNFDFFYIAAELNEKADNVQAAIFLNSVGPEAVELFNTFALSEADKEKYSEVVKAFDDFCSPKKNQVYSSFLFHTRYQDTSEPFDSFLMDLKKLIKPCEFENSDRMLRDRIVLGVNDKNLQKKLLETEGLNSNKAIEMARAAEVSMQQTAVMQNSLTKRSTFEAHTISTKSKSGSDGDGAVGSGNRRSEEGGSGSGSGSREGVVGKFQTKNYNSEKHTQPKFNSNSRNVKERTPRSYRIELENGSTLRRNSRYLRTRNDNTDF